MLDCGIHPGRTGDDALPFFDSGPDASEIDLILISHFHLDHAASLPYFTEKVQVRFFWGGGRLGVWGLGMRTTAGRRLFVAFDCVPIPDAPD